MVRYILPILMLLLGLLLPAACDRAGPVEHPPIENPLGLRIEPDSLTLEVGQQVRLAIQFTNMMPQDSASGLYVFTQLSDSSVIRTQCGTGCLLVQALKPGRSVIIAERSGITNGRAVDTAVVRVVEPTVIGIDVEPAAPAFVSADTLDLVVHARSAFGIQSVIARVDSLESAFVLTQNAWVTRLPMTGLTPGQKVLSITAQDRAGNSYTKSTTFRFDRAAKVALLRRGSVVIGSGPIVESCIDDQNKCAVRIFVEYTEVPAPARPNDPIDLSAFAGRSVLVSVLAVDGASTTLDTTRLFVDVPSPLQEVFRSSGPVLDFSGDRVLYVDYIGSQPRLVVREVLSGRTEVVHDGPVRNARLISGGVVFVDSLPNEPGRLMKWVSGMTSVLEPRVRSNITANGRFAVWSRCDPTQFRYPPIQQFWQDVLSGERHELPTEGSCFFDDRITSETPPGASLAENGWVAKATTDTVWLFDGSALRSVARRITGSSGRFDVRTDGSGVAFHTLSQSLDKKQLILQQGTTQTVIATAPNDRTDIPFDINGGWLAFAVQQDAAPQLMLRSPAGETFGPSVLAGIPLSVGPNGDISARAEAARGARRYLVRRSGSVLELNTPLGRDKWINGRLYVILGNAVFAAP